MRDRRSGGGFVQVLAESAGARAAHPPPTGAGRDQRQLFRDTQDDPDHQEGEGGAAGRDVDEREAAPEPSTEDRLKLTAEVQVTVDCREPGSRCAGRPHLYNPRIGSQLVLSRGRSATGGKKADPVSARQVTSCRGKPLSSRQHHCVIVFTDVRFDVRSLRALPCEPDSCRVNLVMDAHNRHARRGTSW